MEVVLPPCSWSRSLGWLDPPTCVQCKSHTCVGRTAGVVPPGKKVAETPLEMKQPWHGLVQGGGMVDAQRQEMSDLIVQNDAQARMANMLKEVERLAQFVQSTGRLDF